MRVIGVDPGTSSFDVFGIDITDTGDYQVCIDTNLTSKRVAESPQLLLDIITSQEPFDFLAAPSGFGLPIKNVADLTENDIFQLVLRKPSHKPAMGLQAVIELIRNTSWNAFVLPGIKHLPTIPEYRKINKIDLGTSDKLAAAVVGIKDIVETQKLMPHDVNFIMIEMGSAFSAVIGVEKGQIIDGIGGSNLLGFQACGAIDGELAYLMGDITKKTIYSGGVSSIVGFNGMSPEEMILLSQKDPRSVVALDAYIDSLVKGAYSVYSSFKDKSAIQNILLSGRLAQQPHFQSEIRRRLNEIANVRPMKSYSLIAKHAAQGAAFIAEGLHGGPSAPIIDQLKIKEARGSVLDHIYLPLKKD